MMKKAFGKILKILIFVMAIFVGIPIGRQYIRMAWIAMAPFGVEYEEREIQVVFYR